MVKVLVVDDSSFDRNLVGALLEENSELVPIYAEDGKEALAAMKEDVPDLVLTDLQMPEINGLQLVEAIRREYSTVPVILMTAHGSEEIAVAALKKGATSYVPKKNLARDLAETVRYVLNVTRSPRSEQKLLDCMAVSEFGFVLTNDVTSIADLIGHIQDQMAHLNLIDKSGLMHVGTALHEALVNAIEHGNLELTSEMRVNGDFQTYQDLAEERRNRAPFKDRRVHVSGRFSPDEAVLTIGDEGRGFDPSKLPDPTDPANLEKPSGRGLFLIRTFMDEVSFNDRGNQITMIKRRKPSNGQRRS